MESNQRELEQRKLSKRRDGGLLREGGSGEGREHLLSAFFLPFFLLKKTQTIRAGSDLNTVEALISDHLGNTKKSS